LRKQQKAAQAGISKLKKSSNKALKDITATADSIWSDLTKGLKAARKRFA
jgi:ribosome maturation protein Sdo1